MQAVFAEIRNIRIIQGSTEMDLPKSDLQIGEYFERALTSADYAARGFNNELYKMIYEEPKGEYCGKPIPKFEVSSNTVRTQEFYDSYFKSQLLNYMAKDITGTLYNSDIDALDYIIQNQDMTVVRKILCERRGAPRKNRNYILNIKTGKCSCPGQKYHGYCRHSHLAKQQRNKVKKDLVFVLKNKLGDEIGSDLVIHLRGLSVV